MAVIGSIAVEYLAQGARAFIQANKEAAASIAEVETKAKGVQEHLRGMVAPLASVSKGLIRLGDGMVHTGQVLSTFAYRLMLITAPLAKFTYEVGQAGIALETTMAMVATQLDKGEKYIGQFTEETTRYITDLSTQLPLATEDIARAMYFLVSSMTIEPEVARSMLEPIAKAAVAGRATAEESAKAAAVIMNVYKLISENAEETAANLEHVYDVIFEAVKKGRAEYRDMAMQLGDFMQFAKQAGATFEEAMALFAMATRVTTPSQAATWMSNLYRQFIRPKFAEAIAEWGIAIEDTTGKMRPAIEVLADIAEAVGRASGEQEKLNMIAEAFPRIRAVQGFLIFLENLTEIEEWTKSFTEAVGTTDDAFSVMVDTVQAKLTVLKNLFIAIGLDVFETYKEDLKRFLDFLGDVVKKLREMDPELKRQMFAWAGFLVALGPIALVLGTILMGLGSLITMLGALISPPVLGAVIAGFLLFRGELAALWDIMQGISWQEIIAALLGVAQSLGLISDTQADEVLKGLGIAIEDLGLEKVGGLRDSILGLVERLRELSEVGSDALAVVRRFFEMIEKRQGLIGTMIGWLERLAGAFAGVAGGRAPDIGAVETESWARLLDVTLGLGIAIKALPLLLAGLSGAFSLVLPFILSIVGAIAGISPLLLPVAAAIGILVAKFGDWGAVLETVSGILSPVIDRVRRFISGVIDAFYEGGLDEALEYFKQLWPALSQDMKVLIGEAANKSLVALRDFFRGSIAFLQENAPIWADNLKVWLLHIWDTAIDWLGQHVPEWTERIGGTLSDWIEGTIAFLKEGAPVWAQSVKMWLASVWEKVLEFWPQWVETIGTPFKRFEAIIEWLEEQVPGWQQRIWAVLGNLVKGTLAYLKEHMPEWKTGLQEKLDEWITAAVDWLKPRVPVWKKKLQETLDKWIAGAIDWLEKRVRKWKRHLSSVLDVWIAMTIDSVKKRVADWKERLSKNLRQWIENTIDSLKENVSGWKERLSAVIGDWVEGAIQYVGDHYEEWGISIAHSLGEMVGHILVFLQDTLPEWQDRLVQWFSKWANRLIDWVSENWRDWATRLGQFLNDMVVEVCEFLMFKLPEYSERLWSWFAAMWSAFLDGIEETGPEWAQSLIEWFRKDIWTAFLDALEGTLNLIEAGKNWLGGFIQGVKDKASELYTTIKEIVRYAIGKAEEEAEAESESRAMWRLGVNMVRGFIGGIGSQRAALAAALAELAQYQGFSLQPALAGMGAGAQGGEVVHHHYEYNISPRYEQVQSPADIRRDIEALDWARRHYRV